ncbi:glycosyltransferase [Jejuia spongiicola]|uniref:Glycosyltransferase n=1 Tax=Jejuia spongiicola TaxID=2942207 RepID=A0ABT0QDY0_9FLAO|nr:glycosyltransferase [Jejuia spongiicola]MCL6294683.1 glycosyltransferase [Jejuia spongiicola]
MRVLQLIDSLETGGAERAAVNIANSLAEEIDTSFLCATRNEGLLKESLSTRVKFLFLNKKRTLDFKPIIRLNRYVKQQHIDVIHAHSTSFFLATIIKLLNKEVKIIWHDHYGNSEYLHKRKFWILKFCSKYFDHVFSVNSNLVYWAKNHLKTRSISYLANFAVKNKVKSITQLFGKEGKRIVHLANLRSQKDHHTLISAFAKVVKKHPEYTLHCVGKDLNDDYSSSVKKQIIDLGLNNHVFLYGSKPDVSYILSQCSIGVLSSKSEGLPIALLEYGLTGLPVIVTNVGDCKDVILSNDYGLLIKPSDKNLLEKSILFYIDNQSKAKVIGQKLKTRIEKYFSTRAISRTLILTYKKIL